MKNSYIFVLSKEHNIDYNSHNYVINETAIKDLDSYDINNIKKKLIDIKYAQNFLKKYAIKNNNIVTSISKLVNIFTEEFGNIKLNYDTLTIEEKNKYINKYRKTKKLNDDENIDIKSIVNIKSLCIGAYTHLRNYRELKKEMYNNIINFTIDNKKVVTNLKVTYTRKNKYFTKDIFIIMSDQMERNIKKNDNIQFFMDVTYYATPPNDNKYKLLVILAFNNELFKSVIYSLSLIQNENKETFVKVLNFLKIKYSWTPNKITIDYSKAEKNAITYVFPNVEIIPCFYHFMVNINKHLKELKSKNKVLKNFAKDCLANIKLLSFIPITKFEKFYKLIKNKYRAKFSKFLSILIKII